MYDQQIYTHDIYGGFPVTGQHFHNGTSPNSDGDQGTQISPDGQQLPYLGYQTAGKHCIGPGPPIQTTEFGQGNSFRASHGIVLLTVDDFPLYASAHRPLWQQPVCIPYPEQYDHIGPLRALPGVRKRD
jgi:hypothetical protein